MDTLIPLLVSAAATLAFVLALVKPAALLGKMYQRMGDTRHFERH